jgi:hypothetical protein
VQRLTLPDMASREFVSLCFSPDGKQLLAQGGAPDWLLVNIAWQKNKVLQVRCRAARSSQLAARCRLQAALCAARMAECASRSRRADGARVQRDGRARVPVLVLPQRPHHGVRDGR